MKTKANLKIYMEEISYSHSCLLLTLLFLISVLYGGGGAVVEARSRAAGAAAGGGFCASVVSPRGYKCQEFVVTTEDGYLLGLQRIPEGYLRRGGEGGGRSRRRQPVLLQHGVLMDGLTWVLNSPEESLGFILADSGFDVWIANSRGTRSSRAHLSLSASQPAYWDWSWDELLSYDLPATVDFVYQQTGQKLNYVGHSLGTLMVLASFSEGKLVDRIKSAALLSPIAYLSHMTTPLGDVAAKAFVAEIIVSLGVAEFNPKGRIVSDVLKKLCLRPGVDCYDLMTAVTGNNCCLNASTAEELLQYEPQPTSTKTMVHLAQTVRDGVVRKFDYGSDEANVKKYGQRDPPLYAMSAIPADLPLFLSHGGRDSLSDVRDVMHLLDDLSLHDADELAVQYVDDYAHADFVLGVNARDVVYRKIISFFDAHAR